MSDFFEEDFEPPASPEAQAIDNLFNAISRHELPEIVAHKEKITDLYCETGYFCCGPCDCYLPPCNGPDCPDSGCKPWWSRRPEDAGPCWVDPVAKKTRDTLDAIAKIDADFWNKLGKSASAPVMPLSNKRATEIHRVGMMNLSEGIFAGMITTMLQAGAIGGAIVGATQAFYSIFNAYVADANDFLNNVKPYNPGGGST